MFKSDKGEIKKFGVGSSKMFIPIAILIGLLPAALAAVRTFDITIGNAVVSPDGFKRS